MTSTDPEPTGKAARTRRYSTRTRLIITSAAVVSVAIIVTTVISTLVVGRFLEDRVTQRLGATAQRIQATLDGMGGVTLDLHTIEQMAKAEATAVVVDDGVSAPVWADADAELAETLVQLELHPGQPQAVAGHPGLIAVEVDVVGRGLIVRHGDRTLQVTRLILGTDASAQLATVRSMVSANTAAVLVSIGALVILTVVTVSRGLRPLRTMSDQAQAFADGDRSRRLTVPRGDPDITRLATTVNDAFDAQAEAEERLRSFVADASHELRTPLTTASGWIELYFQGGLEDREQRDHALDRVRTQLGRMRVLTDELTLLARLDRERVLDTDPIDLTALVGEVVDDARVMNPHREFSLSATGPAPLLGDGPRLQQVLVNLIENAVQHTPAGTPVEVSVIAATPGRTDTRHVVLVTDHGPGIAWKDQPHVFERFWRSDASRHRHTGGSGLGLSIVASIVAAHGGSCGVTSVPGKGATIRISLPAGLPPVTDRPTAPLTITARPLEVVVATGRSPSRVPSA